MTLVNEDHNHSDTELSDKAKDLVLHGDNDSHLYRSSKIPIVKNLEKKMKNGTYDHEKAKKLWGYHADRAAQSYTKEHGHAGQKWHELFSPKHRKAAASHWADEHQAETALGNFHESDDFAAEIVFAAMGKKATEANLNFKEAVLERSKQLIDDTKVEMAGQFMESFMVETNAKKRMFSHVNHGEQFTFQGEVDHPYSGIAKGPWVKTGSRSYRHADEDYHKKRYGDKDHKVGTTKAKIAD